MNEVWKKPPVSFEAYQDMVGKEIGVSSWHLIDQNRINVYADVIEDHQFIHVDPERARKETAFGNTVAHGFLTMSLMSIMSYEVMPVIEGTTMGVNYGFDNCDSFPRCARARASAAASGLPKPGCASRRSCSRVPVSPSKSRARKSPRWWPTGSA